MNFVDILGDLYDPANNYCIYLRKSRADIEAEHRGEGETLLRHLKALSDLARRLNIRIGAIYHEIVSGDSIASRPEMKKLLADASIGRWKGVLVMEVERLARGDTMDQGRVAQVFKYSSTQIITPYKTYDPSDEMDEEFFEFNLFMSRREYKTITRRLQAGRIASVKDGHYIGSVRPYGYRRVRLENGVFTLEPIPEEAEIVRKMYAWRLEGHGPDWIANKLNDQGAPSARGGPWVRSAIVGILANPVNVGMVRWNCRKVVKTMTPQGVVASRPRAQDFLVCQGLHPAIVEPAVFRAVQALPRRGGHVSDRSLAIKNPFAGLIFCALCGRPMTRRPAPRDQVADMLICTTRGCPCVGSAVERVEAAVLAALQSWLDALEPAPAAAPPVAPAAEDETAKTVARLGAELTALRAQKSRLQDLLEREIYTEEDYVERAAELKARISRAQNALSEAKNQRKRRSSAADTIAALRPRIVELMDIYPECAPEERNRLLQTVIERVDYAKTERGHRYAATPFTLKLSPVDPTD